MNMNNTDAVNSTAMNVTKAQGRRKIAMKPIANQNSRHVTFSKRRSGLFKKASELCILCGVEIAIIVQSLKRQRLFTFGHPSADAIIDRIGCGEEEIIDESKRVKGNNNGFWWNESIDDMGIEDLDKFVDALEELKKRVNMRVDELNMIKGSSSLPSTSTMNQAIDYCASVVPFDFN
ncbi:hypothetical protein BC332_11191 [Capsicum chinense]|nr:hypothetical protein BC332_11191 [Capsicum chinense]